MGKLLDFYRQKREKSGQSLRNFAKSPSVLSRNLILFPLVVARTKSIKLQFFLLIILLFPEEFLEKNESKNFFSKIAHQTSIICYKFSSFYEKKL